MKHYTDSRYGQPRMLRLLRSWRRYDRGQEPMTTTPIQTLVIMRRERVIKQEGNYLLVKVDLRKERVG